MTDITKIWHSRPAVRGEATRLAGCEALLSLERLGVSGWRPRRTLWCSLFCLFYGQGLLLLEVIRPRETVARQARQQGSDDDRVQGFLRLENFMSGQGFLRIPRSPRVEPWRQKILHLHVPGMEALHLQGSPRDDGPA